MRDFFEFALEVILPLILISAFVMFIFILPMNYYSSWQCENFQKVTGRESLYINFDACYVKNKNGDFVRYDSKYKE